MPPRKKSFRIDLTNIEGEGVFPCPRCGAIISPDDETENVYTVIETIGEDDSLESLTIQCKKCNNTIILEGFAGLFEQSDSRIGISEALPESKPGLKTQHNISLDGQDISQIVVDYAQKGDVEAFKKLRTLKIGEPLKGTLIKNTEREFKDKDLREIINTVKKKFKGLKDSDIYIVENKDGRQNFIGRASNLLGS